MNTEADTNGNSTTNNSNTTTTGTDTNSTTSGATPSPSTNTNTSATMHINDTNKDIFPISLLHMDYKSICSLSNTCIICKNILVVCGLLIKKLVLLDKAAWITLTGG